MGYVGDLNSLCKGFQQELDTYYPYNRAGALWGIYRYSHRLQIQSVCEMLNKELNRQKLLLDAGCACGPYSMLLSNKVKVVGIDLSPIEIRKAKEWRNLKCKNSEIDFIVGDIRHLPFKDSVFDVVLCSEVLEHLPNIRDGLKELYRLMKRGGIGVISMPNSISLYYILQRFLPVVTSKKENPHLDFHFSGITNTLLSLGPKLKILVVKSSLIVPLNPSLRFYESVVKGMRLVERKLNKTPIRNVGAHYMLKFQKIC